MTHSHTIALPSGNSFFLYGDLESIAPPPRITVFAPGWATTVEVFDYLSSTPNREDVPLRIECQILNPFEFVADFIRAITQWAKDLQVTAPLTINWIGFSLGARLGVAFVENKKNETQGNLVSQAETTSNSALATHAFTINSMTAIGARPSYPLEAITALKTSIKTNKTKAMKQFYRACFSNPFVFKKFLKTHGDDWNELWTEEHLLAGLDYLQQTPYPSDTNASSNLGPATEGSKAANWPTVTTFIHGDSDNIAPLADIKPYAEQLGCKLDIQPGGHIS